MKEKLLNTTIRLFCPTTDFVLIISAFFLSHKLCQVLGIGLNVYDENIRILQVSLFAAFLTIVMMLGFGVYKHESSPLNVEEIKNVIRGITMSLLLIGVISAFQKIRVSGYILFLSYFFSLFFVIAEKMILYHILLSLGIKSRRIEYIPVIREKVFSPYLYVKKILDLILAITALLLFLPLFLIIAMAIKLDSKGPVFFIQDRVGKDGSIFEIYKFRSMHTDSEPYAVNPLERNDPRITEVGRYLRKTSLDELPQIINVLKGEMSFVGPRPEMSFIVAEYNDVHKERLKVLPGITGLWQLSSDRKKAIHENMEYDLYYRRNVSFFLDIAILIETLIFAFKGI